MTITNALHPEIIGGQTVGAVSTDLGTGVIITGSEEGIIEAHVMAYGDAEGYSVLMAKVYAGGVDGQIEEAVGSGAGGTIVMVSNEIIVRVTGLQGDTINWAVHLTAMVK